MKNRILRITSGHMRFPTGSCRDHFAHQGLGDRPNAEKAVQEAVSKLQDINTEWRVNLPDGEGRWLMSRGRPVFDGQNQVTSYLGVVIDITDRT